MKFLHLEENRLKQRVETSAPVRSPCFPTSAGSIRKSPNSRSKRSGAKDRRRRWACARAAAGAWSSCAPSSFRPSASASAMDCCSVSPARPPSSRSSSLPDSLSNLLVYSLEQLEFWISVALTVLGYLPGVLYAIYVILTVDPRGRDPDDDYYYVALIAVSRRPVTPQATRFIRTPRLR
ncbi:hypothetical protein PR202_gb17673 [Eleusine coracana subsp. coracana]|uniref:Uncharacterized protein n=1 Tax=Eleusine coracana subsp. coracana TaxID=191504 RepID=A0AAV5F2X9_ELECO|nr:hypothetical protein PR202_gb17673 [Eleusine coracana subsp. coracana]